MKVPVMLYGIIQFSKTTIQKYGTVGFGTENVRFWLHYRPFISLLNRFILPGLQQGCRAVKVLQVEKQVDFICSSKTVVKPSLPDCLIITRSSG